MVAGKTPDQVHLDAADMKQRQHDNLIDSMSARIPLNGREMRVVEHLTCFDSKLIEAGECLRERLKQIPNGWRQWRLMASISDKLLRQLYDTMPLKNLRHIQNLCYYGEVLIRMKPAVRPPEYTLISTDDLAEVVNVAMGMECRVCIRDGKEIERCRLRQAMMNIAPPLDVSDLGCSYRDVALEHDYGQYSMI